MSAIESVMARMIPTRSIRFADLPTLFTIVACLFTAHIGYTQSSAEALNDALVRVNVTFEIRGTEDVLEFRKRLLDDYNPVFIQNFPSTGIVLGQRDQVMAFLGVGKYFIPDSAKYEIVTSKGQLYTGKLVGIDRGNGAAVIRIPDKILEKTLVCTGCDIRNGTVVFAPVKGPSGTLFQEARIISTELNRDAQGQSAWKIRMNRPFLEERYPVFTQDLQALGFIEKDESVRYVLHPVSELLSSSEKIIDKNGDIRNGYLGILPDDYRNGPVSGVVIKSVTKDSPAQKAGLAVHDIVLKYDGRDVLNASRFVDLVQATPVGSDVEIRVLRRGKPTILNAQIQTRKLGNPMDFLLKNIQNTINSELADIFPPQGGQPRMHAVGFNAVVLTPEVADELQIQRRSGLLVYNLVKQAPAGLAGIKNGDVIVSVNEQPFSDTSQFFSYLQSLQSGSTVTMKVDRNGSEQIISLKLPEQNQ
jgi:S1-C subfamily serine protease